VQGRTELSKVLKLNEDDKFDLSTKVAQNKFISLLSDDYLFSELSKKYYDSKAKKPMEK
jgi:hypothetical protein